MTTPVAPVLTIDGNDVTEEVYGKQYSVRLNALDATLLNPASIPMLGDDVWSENPPWNGTVASTSVSDLREIAGGDVIVKVTATNSDAAVAAAGPALVDTAHDYRQLVVTRTMHDSTEEVRGTFETLLTTIRPGYTFTLTSDTHGFAAQSFTAVDVSVSWLKPTQPLFKVSFGDAIVTMSVWANSTEAGLFPIDRTKITDGEVTTPKLAANSITAEKLESTLVLGTTIAAPAATGARVQLDPQGFHAFSSAGAVLVDIPVDGSANKFAGEVDANLLVVTGDADFQGATNEISIGGGLILDSQLTAPVLSPVLVQGWADPLTLATPAFTTWESSGGYYDSAGGANGATACFVAIVVDEASSPDVYHVYEWKLSDGTLDRDTILSLPAAFAGYGNEAFITRIGTSWYIAAYNTTTSSRALYKFVRSSGALTTGPTDIFADFYLLGGFYNSAGITNDGTFLYVQGDNAAREDGKRIAKYNTSLVYQSNVVLTDSERDTSSPLYADIGAGGRFFTSTDQQTYVYQYLTTGGAFVANTYFPRVTGARTWGDALIWDGTNFKSVNYGSNYQGHDRKVYTYTNWDWTTESNVYWVSYSFYDSVGATHETEYGPRASITMERRKQLTMTSQVIPGSGGADEPTNIRFYMKRNATDPGATACLLQATNNAGAGVAATTVLTTYNAAGATGPATDDFPTGTPAILRSAGTEWKLSGDGKFSMGAGATQDVYQRRSATKTLTLDSDGAGTTLTAVDFVGAFQRGFSGTAFPASPATNDRFYRTDLGMWFFWNGTYWLSVDQLVGKYTRPRQADTNPLSVTGGVWDDVIPHPTLSIYMETLFGYFYVITTSSATKYWTFTDGRSGVTLSTVSNTADTWVLETAAVNALLDLSSPMSMTSAKVSTPGNVYATLGYTYRLRST